MLTIRTLFYEFKIDNSKEYAIYEESYKANYLGQPLDPDSQEVETGKYYEYGNIIFFTETKKYSITKVYCAYEWVVELLDFIDSKKNDENIFINMNSLVKLDDDYKEFECGEIYVESIWDAINKIGVISFRSYSFAQTMYSEFKKVFGKNLQIL